MNLSKNFTLAEMTASQTATRHGIDNSPSAAHLANLRRLVTELLQPLRDALGHVISVSSGYRSPTLNTRVGGSATSAHSIGMAADINARSYGDARQLAIFIRDWLVKNKIPFDQLILEFGTWVHIGLMSRTGQQRRQVLTARRDVYGKTEFVTGIV